MASAVSRRVAVVIGTRPELIKLAPVVSELKRSSGLEPYVILTGQHDSMMRTLVDDFALPVDTCLELPSARTDIPSLTADLIFAINGAVDGQIAGLVVQGDTSSALAGAMVGGFRKMPVFHVEAGLRSGDFGHPFPEEFNRRLVATLSTVHFAPTETARAALLSEGFPASAVRLVGNTVVDALLGCLESGPQLPGEFSRQAPGLLVTLHRRENWGTGIGDVCAALRRLLDERPDLTLVFPMHPNEAVRQKVLPQLGGHPRAHLIEPVNYTELVALLDWCKIVVTDSGGIQEEAPALGKPVVVCREKTERPEGVHVGNAVLVGTNQSLLEETLSTLLDDKQAYDRMSNAVNPYGDGIASRRIGAELEVFFGLRDVPMPQFNASQSPTT